MNQSVGAHVNPEYARKKIGSNKALKIAPSILLLDCIMEFCIVEAVMVVFFPILTLGPITLFLIFAEG